MGKVIQFPAVRDREKRQAERIADKILLAWPFFTQRDRRRSSTKAAGAMFSIPSVRAMPFAAETYAAMKQYNSQIGYDNSQNGNGGKDE